ncbi:MAG: DUF3379 family protein [Lysobacterales bacterium]
MDCLEFQRRLGSDPQVAAAAARAHLATCASCAQAAVLAEVFERRLGDAFAVPVPAGLAERILIARDNDARTTGSRSRDGRRYAWLALAAAAGLALAIGIVREQRAQALPDLVVAHINGEERDVLNLRTPVSAASIEHAFADRGVHLASVPDGVSYVNECPIGKYRSVHMVMPQNDAPVSVIYVVDHRGAASKDFHRDALRGREVPIADGTLVLAARTDDHFDAIEHTWRDAIEGPAQVAAGSR